MPNEPFQLNERGYRSVDHLAHLAFTPMAREPELFDRIDPAEPAPHILVVDDDPSVRYVVTALLQRAGFRVTEAEDGEAAWEALQATSFDLLVTDHNMPRLTGLDLLRRIRAKAMVLPTLLISAAIPWDEADLPRLLEPGAVLSKPFSLAGLLACVHPLLAESPARRDEEVLSRR
jgi:DNA-binding response OmpR family regulator